MSEIQFDAVLNDQMTAPLAAIADALAGISEAVATVSKDFTAAFESMTQKAVAFADVMPEVGTQVDAVAEKIGLFADESAVNYTQAMKQMQDANTTFFGNSDENINALQGEADAVTQLAGVFDTLASNKDLAGIAEEDLKNATDGASAAMTGETGAAAATAAAVTAEGDAGTANQPDRETGYGAVMGAVALLGMAGAAIKIGESMLTSGIQAQAALTMVTSLADQNTAHIGTYEQGLQQIALSTGASLTDLAGGLYDIASVGFQGADGLTILAQAAKAAAVGGTSLHDVTNGLTSIMIAFDMNAKDSASALNTLVIGVRDGKAHFADFSRAIGLVGDTAKNANFSFNESTAALSAMSAVYPTVRQAGQNLRSLMQDLGMKMDTVAKNAHKMGLKFDEQKFASLGLYDRLMYLKQITGGNQAEMTKLLGGVQGLNAYFAITASGGARFTQALHDMQTQTGTLDNAFATYQQSMQAHIQKLSASVGVLSANFALLAQPVVLGALNLLTTLVVALSDAFQNHANIMIPVLITLVGLIGGLLVGAIAALGEAMSKFIGEALETASPFIIIGVAIGLLVSYLVSAYRHSAPFRDALHQLGAALGSMWAALQPLLTSLKQMVSNALRPLIDILFGSQQAIGKNHDALKNIKSPIDLITLGIQALTGWVNQFTQWLGHLHQKMMDVVAPTTTLGRGLGGLRTFVENLRTPTDHVRQTFDVVNATFKETAGAGHRVAHAFKPIGATVGTVSQALIELLVPAKNIGATVHTTATHVKTFGDYLRQIIGVIVQVAGALLGVGGAAFLIFRKGGIDSGAVMGKFFDIIKGGAKFFVQFSDAIYGFVKGALDSFLKYFLDGGDLVADLIRGIDKFHLSIGKISEAILKFGGWLRNIMSGGFDKFLISIYENFDMIIGAITSFTQTALVFTGVALIIAGIVAGTVMQFKHWYDTSSQFRAMLASFVGDLKGLWTTLQAQIHPVFQQLAATWKTQILPLGAQLMELWKSIQPALMLVGAIVIGILVVAFGVLVNIIKAVISALGPFLTGVIQIIGGIIKVVVGFVQVIVTVVGGIATLLYDLFFNQQAFASDALKLWDNLKNGIANIVGGLGSILMGLWNAIVVTIVTIVVTFVTGIISWFQHLFDTLVGHSIVTDLTNKILALFTFIFVTIPDLAIKFVLSLLMKFQMLVTLAENFFIGLSLSIPATFIQMVTNILNAALHLENELFLYLNEMVVRAIQFFVQLQLEAPILVNQMVATLLAIVQSLETGAINLVIGLVSGLVSTLGNLVSLLPSPVQNAITAVFNVLSGALTNALNWGQNFMSNLTKGISNGLGGLKNIVGNVASAIAGPLAHHSPAKEGPLADDDQWMPTMMNQLQKGIEGKTPNVKGAAMGAAQAIQQGFATRSGAMAPGGAASGVMVAGGGGFGGGGAAGGAQTLNITINLQGGLGAGLQLLNASDRKTFIAQIAQELAHQMNLQGRPANGYSGF